MKNFLFFYIPPYAEKLSVTDFQYTAVNAEKPDRITSEKSIYRGECSEGLKMMLWYVKGW